MKRYSKTLINSYSSSSNVAMIRMMNQDREIKRSTIELLKLIMDPDDGESKR